MQLPLSPRAQQNGLVSDSDFWLRDLRLGAYHDLVRQIHDPAFRAEHLARRFPRRRHLVYLADRGEGGISAVDPRARLSVP